MTTGMKESPPNVEELRRRLEEAERTIGALRDRRAPTSTDERDGDGLRRLQENVLVSRQELE
jgi:hypothetical protein